MDLQMIEKIQKVVNKAEIVDLSYTLEPGMPVWSSHARFGAIVYETYDEGDVSYHRQVSYGEHTGTHIDAPRHFFREGAAIDHVKVKAVMGRGVCIDASFLKPCEEYTLDMLKAFEAEYGEIQEGDVILFSFGWEEKYAIGKKGGEFLKDWPGLGESAAKYLADKKVASVGTDALALDPFGSEKYPSHQVLLGNRIPILENLTNLKKIPVFSYIIGLANKIKDGSGSPIRIIALT